MQRNPANTRYDAASWPQPRQLWGKRRKRRRRGSRKLQVMPLNGVRGHAIASTTAVAVRPVTTIYSARAHFSAVTAILTLYPLWAHASCAWWCGPGARTHSGNGPVLPLRHRHEYNRARDGTEWNSLLPWQRNNIYRNTGFLVHWLSATAGLPREERHSRGFRLRGLSLRWALASPQRLPHCAPSGFRGYE